MKKKSNIDWMMIISIIMHKILIKRERERERERERVETERLHQILKKYFSCIYCSHYKKIRSCESYCRSDIVCTYSSCDGVLNQYTILLIQKKPRSLLINWRKDLLASTPSPYSNIHSLGFGPGWSHTSLSTCAM